MSSNDGEARTGTTGPRAALRRQASNSAHTALRGPAGTWARALSAHVSYELLYNAANSPRWLRHFAAGVGYAINDHVQLQWKYHCCEDERTMARLHFWEFTIGVRF